ncbi:MAG: glycosyltransferase, partial [Patescibacteria group bacterium]|nr:glycosyltransferase [Patescibacteria group bacterium]
LKHEEKLLEIEIKGGVKILRLPYSNNKFSIWKNLLTKKELINQADIIHCHDVFFWYLPFKFLFPNKKVFTTFHGWEGKYPIPKKNIFIRKISEKLSNANICVGDYIKKHYGTKSNFVTYGGVNHQDNIYQPTINFKNITQITFIGRLEKDLSLDKYLKALAILKNKYNFKIIFIGDGPYRKQAEKLGTVTGFVKNIKPYLKKPSLVFSSSYLTILETMLAGRPVFSLYQNQLKKDYLKLFPGAKYIHISGSANELVSQVKNSLQGRTLQVKKAHAFAKTQTWDKVINIYLKLWNQN